jgi:hypothetical protein
MMMSLPSEVKIGGVVYTIVPDKRLSDEYGILGRARCQVQVIELDADMARDAKAATLLHEVIHAILYQTGHDEHVEPHIRALGYGLLVFMRDNADWIRSIL